MRELHDSFNKKNRGNKRLNSSVLIELQNDGTLENYIPSHSEYAYC